MRISPVWKRKNVLVNWPSPKIGLNFTQIWVRAYLSPVIVKEIVPVRSANVSGIYTVREMKISVARRMRFVENCVENQSHGGGKRRLVISGFPFPMVEFLGDGPFCCGEF